MSSICYGDNDFSDYVTAELVEPCGRAVEPRTLAVPGRPGAVLLGGEVGPKVLRVRLFLDAGLGLDASQLARLRHMMYAWLLEPDGTTLEVPGDPLVCYRDAVCTDASDWSSLFTDGSCEVEFTCYDPFGYGEFGNTAGTEFTVGGTAATWPSARVVAAAGTAVKVTDADSGKFVLVEYDFEAGDVVDIDFGAETVEVNGEDMTYFVTVGSDFFSLAPGGHTLAFEGEESHVVYWQERWV